MVRSSGLAKLMGLADNSRSRQWNRRFVGCFKVFAVESVESFELKPGRLKGDVV